MRAQIGLAPLVASDCEESGSESEQVESDGYAEREDVHVPAENQATIKKSEKLKEKLELSKKKRAINTKLE